MIEPAYDRTQRGYFAFFVVPIFVAIAGVYGWSTGSVEGTVVFAAVAVIVFVISLFFSTLRVYDGGTALHLDWGPILGARVRLPYAEMASAERARSRFIDGWGIHWVPGRGWTYNIWGYDCVEIRKKSGKVCRVGTEDPEGLTRFLESRISETSR